MKKLLRHIPILTLLAVVLPFCSSCESEDDVIDIFTGKVWKMSYIFPEGHVSTPENFWNGDQEAYEASSELGKDQANFNLVFQGGTLKTGQMGGTFQGRGANATVEGYWEADGNTHALQFSNVHWNGTETDVLAKAFMTGVSSVYKYSGDSGNLYLHYKDGQLLRVIALIPKK